MLLLGLLMNMLLIEWPDFSRPLIFLRSLLNRANIVV